MIHRTLKTKILKEKKLSYSLVAVQADKKKHRFCKYSGKSHFLKE